jgi:hypothetical protein
MRDYADKLADALGAGYDTYTATLYARGSFRLPRATRRRVARAGDPDNSRDKDNYRHPENTNSSHQDNSRNPRNANSTNHPDQAPGAASQTGN